MEYCLLDEYTKTKCVAETTMHTISGLPLLNTRYIICEIAIYPGLPPKLCCKIIETSSGPGVIIQEERLLNDRVVKRLYRITRSSCLSVLGFAVVVLS